MTPTDATFGGTSIINPFPVDLIGVETVKRSGSVDGPIVVATSGGYMNCKSNETVLQCICTARMRARESAVSIHLLHSSLTIGDLVAASVVEGLSSIRNGNSWLPRRRV